MIKKRDGADTIMRPKIIQHLVMHLRESRDVKLRALSVAASNEVRFDSSFCDLSELGIRFSGKPRTDQRLRRD